MVPSLDMTASVKGTLIEQQLNYVMLVSINELIVGHFIA